MIDLYEINTQMDRLHTELDELREKINPEQLNKEIGELSEQTETPGFWEDQSSAQKLIRTLNSKKSKVDTLSDLEGQIEDIDILIELYQEGEEVDDLEDEIKACQKHMEDFRLETFLTGEYDENNAIIAIHPGSGGTESNDWAEMLLRMYTRWAEDKGYKVKTIDIQPGGVAGIKSATLLIEGKNAYGFLKTEKGVHRLVRISPFDSSGRRHTSFASLDVTPEVDNTVEIEINPDDLRVDTYRSSGAGGQHVNKTSSAIRITHLPTGIVVQCQNERSQHQNKEVAMNLLKSKLIALLEEENQEKLDDLKGDYGQITWGQQIRSYVFQPYTMVKDHRTNTDTANITGVMDGDLDQFIYSYLISDLENV